MINGGAPCGIMTANMAGMSSDAVSLSEVKPDFAPVNVVHLTRIEERYYPIAVSRCYHIQISRLSD